MEALHLSDEEIIRILPQPTNRVKAATADFDPEVAIRELQAILNWDNKYKSMGAFIGFEVSSVNAPKCSYSFHLDKNETYA